MQLTSKYIQVLHKLFFQVLLHVCIAEVKTSRGGMRSENSHLYFDLLLRVVATSITYMRRVYSRYDSSIW